MNRVYSCMEKLIFNYSSCTKGKIWVINATTFFACNGIILQSNLTSLDSDFFLGLRLQVIQRNNATSIACTNVADIPPDLVNPGAVELVLDIRREYATKFEEVIHLSLSLCVLLVKSVEKSFIAMPTSWQWL